MDLYRQESSDPKNNAQRNLMGRTHYVDDDTLRFHHGRVLSSSHVADGLLFYIIESVGLDSNNKNRGFRYVIFDVFGNVIGTRADLEHCWKRSEQAIKACAEELKTLDARAITEAAIAEQERCHARDIADLRATLAKIGAAKAA